ncbi:primosomal protein N' [Sinosporangium siamense]|uniref:Probable replication restart protein PriA n=1 Tax=Sinosporangium siamense TaxID=1367973 RepID=A0A919V4Z7_9ACTN|nr:hypothetical protein Ssi02_05170 [Sinosporangium siamense]
MTHTLTSDAGALLPLAAVRTAPGGGPRTAARPARKAAASLPVARVAVDNPLPHLDRLFDYLVPEALDATAVPGCRVRVRFAGKLADGFLMERVATTDHKGTLTPLDRVVSPEPVVTPEIAGLARAVADHYAGTLADVFRLAVPPRHARVEGENRPERAEGGATGPAEGGSAPIGSGGENAGSGGEASASSEGSTGRPGGDSAPIGSGGEDAGSGGEASASAEGPVGRPGGDSAPIGSGGEDAGSGGEASASAEGPAGRPGGDSAPIGSGEGAEGGGAPLGPEGGGRTDLTGGVSATMGPGGAGDVNVPGGARSGPEGGGGAADGPAGQEGRPAGAGAASAAREAIGGWADYPMGGSFLAALAEGRAPRAVWTALPGVGPEGPRWPAEIARAVQVTLRTGKGAVVVLPDGKDVARVDAALTALLGPGTHVALTADLGPAERYRRWLRLLRGEAAAVVGTRATAFAPVRDVGLVVVWDDGDDLHSEPHAPYPHTREVLALRAHRARCALLIGGHSRTAEATQLAASGWVRPIAADREAVRRSAPRVRTAGEEAELARDQAARAARLPTLAWRALKEGLTGGPVLVQVPRRGYVPAVACQGCRELARCGSCHGPLGLRSGHAAPACRWCGRIAGDWRCPACGAVRVRAVVVGARRTAEELGRAFPSVRVKTSGRDGVLASVNATPALVVATPGAEPVPEGGYAAAVLLDGWALLGRADLRAGEEALRRWMNAAALLRPRAELVVLANAALPAVQALLRWDPVTHAERELADRAELGFPPAVRMATLTGSPAAVREMLAETRLPGTAEVLGPVPVETGGRRPAQGEREIERALVRAPRAGGAELVAALKGASGVRSARKTPEVVRICVDPLELI